jgi:hypothetical protein
VEGSTLRGNRTPASIRADPPHIERRGTSELKDELAGMLPFAPIASLPIELDARTGFADCFTHAGGRKQARSAGLTRKILAVLIGMATNLGLTRMAEACGIPYDVLRWTQEWYVREETLREANTVIVNHHHSLELAKVFGGGTMSSSDGQRFPCAASR